MNIRWNGLLGILVTLAIAAVVGVLAFGAGYNAGLAAARGAPAWYPAVYGPGSDAARPSRSRCPARPETPAADVGPT